MNESTDRVMRAMTVDGAFRVIAAVTSETVAGAIERQGIGGVTAMRVGELITGAVLLREATAPGRRVQIIVRDGQGGSLVADAHPDGSNRAMVMNRSGRALDFSNQALMQVAYTLPNGELHQGVVELSADGGISESLMSYMQVSEQVVSTIAVAAVPAEGRVGAAGGYLVQLLPDADRDALERMTERLGSFDELERILAGDEPSPGQLIESLLAGIDYAPLADTPLCFGCTCSRDRVLRGLVSLPAADLEELVAAEETLEIRCDACGATYELEPGELGAFVRDVRGDGESN